jgi:hypothetical protein
MTTYSQSQAGLAEDGECIRRSGRRDIWPAAQFSEPPAPARGLDSNLFDNAAAADAPAIQVASQ